VCFFIYLFVPTNARVCVEDYSTNAATCFGASASSSGSFDIAFAKVVIKLLKLHKTVDCCVIKGIKKKK
jgi:hypothetical protein